MNYLNYADSLVCCQMAQKDTQNAEEDAYTNKNPTEYQEYREHCHK